jgi:hypothetical protein
VSAMAKQPPKKPAKSDSLLGWLGRQLGHVKKAVSTDVTKPPTKPKPKVIYRENKVEEAEIPTQPGVKLRRTVIDEVIVDPNKRMK